MALFSTLSRNPVALSSRSWRAVRLVNAGATGRRAALALYGPFAPQTQQSGGSRPESDGNALRQRLGRT